jgi:hypothetical protein
MSGYICHTEENNDLEALFGPEDLSLASATWAALSFVMKREVSLQSSKCISGCSGPKIYFPKTRDICEVVESHPDYTSEKVQGILNRLAASDWIEDRHNGYVPLR